MKNNEKSLQAAYVYVFTASFCLMVIEIVAGRIMAPYLGMSLYTWTSVIGIVLTGITVGNYVGGVIAEKGTSWKNVGIAFTLAAFVLALSFFVHAPVADLLNGFPLPIMIATIVFAFVAFFPMSFLLSTITPMVITMSLTSLKKTGTTVGSIYAVSAAASIAGTFLSGFVLIAFFGVKTIVMIVSALLLIAGITAAKQEDVSKSKPVLLAVFMLWVSLLVPTFCIEETAYYCINIAHLETERGQAKLLVLDRLTHSYVFHDPRAIEYDYENVYAVVTEYLNLQNGKVPSAMFIGGGGYVMPRFIQDNYDDTDITVVEIDPGVTKAAQDYFGLNPETDIRTIHEDARTYFAYHVGDKRYDVIFGDAFNDYSVPYHLTTEEFFKLVSDHLSEDGIYALNLIDDYRNGRVLASFVKTASQVFSHVEVAPLSNDWQTPGRNTFVLIASNAPILQDRWMTAARIAFDTRITPPASKSLDETTYFLSRSELLGFVSDRRGIVLTDDYVPIDNFVASLFERTL